MLFGAVEVGLESGETGDEVIIAWQFFAYLALANSISMEIMTRMYGYSYIRTIKIYAKVIDKSIAEQMSGLAAKSGLQK